MAESGDDGISALIAEFVECTDASVDVAKELLEKSSGNLELAVNRYMDELASVPLQASATRRSQSIGFSLLTWNVDGLDDADVPERARAVCAYIYESQPDIVFLQEVIAENVSIFKRCPGYLVIVPRENQCPYFCCLMLRKESVKCLSYDATDFPSSSMFRHFIKAVVQLQPSGLSVTLFTSHLESTAQFATERKRQLKFVFDQMQQASSDFVVFGGDLNVRDAEIKVVGLPPNVLDAWEAAGSPRDRHYSWDRSQNDNIGGRFLPRVKYRFDRVYFSRELKLESFQFVGKDRLPSCGRFPSDHFGLTCRFVATTAPGT